MDSGHMDMMMQAMLHGLDALEQWSNSTGLGGVMYPEEHEGHMGMGVEWEMYTGGQILSEYRTRMREHVRDDMYGMLLGVKNILPGKATTEDVGLALLTNEEEMNVHTVSKYTPDAVERNGDALDGDYVLMVSGLLVDKSYVHARRKNGGQTQFVRHEDDWNRAPSLLAMRYWMDMPV